MARNRVIVVYLFTHLSQGQDSQLLKSQYGIISFVCLKSHGDPQFTVTLYMQTIAKACITNLSMVFLFKSNRLSKLASSNNIAIGLRNIQICNITHHLCPIHIDCYMRFHYGQCTRCLTFVLCYAGMSLRYILETNCLTY